MIERTEPSFDVIESTLRGQAPDDISVVTALITELMASGALDEETEQAAEAVSEESVR